MPYQTHIYCRSRSLLVMFLHAISSTIQHQFSWSTLPQQRLIFLFVKTFFSVSFLIIRVLPIDTVSLSAIFLFNALLSATLFQCNHCCLLWLSRAFKHSTQKLHIHYFHVIPNFHLTKLILAFVCETTLLWRQGTCYLFANCR